MRQVTAGTPRSGPWTPIRSGQRYCSPACGRGCTFQAYQSATRHARALARRLGPPWVPAVWENLGWHWAASRSNGLLKVHPVLVAKDVRGYNASLDGGRWTAYGNTPKEAAALAITRARADHDGISTLLAKVTA